MIQVTINDPDTMLIAVTVSGKYNPDILDDVKRRTLDAYREALAFRTSLLGIEVAEAPTEEAGES